MSEWNHYNEDTGAGAPDNDRQVIAFTDGFICQAFYDEEDKCFYDFEGDELLNVDFWCEMINRPGESK